MLYEVTLLRRQGLRLRQAELQPPIVGRLNVFDWEGKGNSRQRMIRVLEVRVTFNTTMEQPAARISDPVLIASLDGGTLVFAGIELESRDGRIYEHQQIWRVRPTTAEKTYRPPRPNERPSEPPALQVRNGLADEEKPATP